MNPENEEYFNEDDEDEGFCVDDDEDGQNDELLEMMLYFTFVNGM